MANPEPSTRETSSGIEYYSGGVLYPRDNVTWENQLKGKATYYAENFLRSEHEFRFGVQYSYGSVLTNSGIGPNGMYEYNYDGEHYRAYQAPYQYGGINKDFGFFVDDTVTVNNKLTLNLGIRFDHNTGHMPEFDILKFGQPSVSAAGRFAKTGQTTSRVDVLNWNIVSPRLEVVFQPRGDGRSKIQGSFGVYYDHNVSGNWDYPPAGLGTFAVYRYNPDTGEKSDKPVHEIRAEDVSINPDLRPPRTLQYSVGYDHQIGESMAFGTQYVYKTTKDLVGWEILSGEYKEVPFTDPYTGKQYTLLSIVENENPILRKGNDPGDFPGSENLDYFQKYHGLIFTFDKRFSNSWSIAASYTWSRSTGLIPLMLFQGQGPALAFVSPTEGRDPNHYINAEGRLQNDRPHMFRILSYVQDLPGGLHASANIDFSSGKHHVVQSIQNWIRTRPLRNRCSSKDPLMSSCSEVTASVRSG
jgi:TonB dependent receptor-like, beta-barrel